MGKVANGVPDPNGVYPDALQFWNYDGENGPGRAVVTLNDDGKINFEGDLKVKNNTFASCNWDGDKSMIGKETIGDDLIITCKGNKVTNMKMNV